MPKPYLLDEAFEINHDLELHKSEYYWYIDNFYKNIDLLERTIQDSYVPNWKICEGSRNFVDYYDCRIQLPVFMPEVHGNLYECIRKISPKFKTIDIPDEMIDFNVFSDIKGNFGGNIQQYPHYDFAVNCIVYIDGICGGGTAIYEDADIENLEEENLAFDTSSLKIRTIIPAVRNRLIIYDGDYLHGAYINPDSYTNDHWRINQVIFFPYQGQSGDSYD